MRVLLRLLIISVALFTSGCSLTQTGFDVQPDESDFINYAFGGGELGADWTQLTIRGDGHIIYLYRLPYAGNWPQEEITKEHKLSEAETKALFQSLVDAGLFDLKSQETQGADIPRTNITVRMDEHDLEVAMDGTPDEGIHSQIREIIKEIHPAR